MEPTGSEELREMIRVLVRNLGFLEQTDASCCGVTIAQCHAIVEIGRKGRMSLVDLADGLGLDKSTMSRTVNGLVNSGLVSRELDSENRRYVAIQLTANGAEAFRHIEESMGKYYRAVLGSIPAEKRDQVLESLRLLAAAVKENKCCQA